MHGRILFILLLAASSVKAQFADSMLTFLTANKSRVALFLSRNEEPVAHVNETKMLPLAQVMNILIVIEFAKQTVQDQVFDQDMVPLTDLEKYYIPETDEEIHEKWVSYAKGKRLVKDDSVRLIDVARGMMLFNDNANAGYLMDLLGIENITSNLRILNIEKHSGITAMVATMFMYQKGKRKEDAILKEMKKMDDFEYCRTALQIHRSLENESGFNSRFRLKEFTPALQKMWSERLTASTAKQYADVASILNRRLIFDDAIYAYIAEIMELFMESPESVESFRHAAVVKGSTPFLLTKTLYCTLKKNKTRVELSYFLNDLTAEEHEKLNKWTADFDEEVMKSESFRQRLAEALN